MDSISGVHLDAKESKTGHVFGRGFNPSPNPPLASFKSGLDKRKEGQGRG